MPITIIRGDFLLRESFLARVIIVRKGFSFWTILMGVFYLLRIVCEIPTRFIARGRWVAGFICAGWVSSLFAITLCSFEVLIIGCLTSWIQLAYYLVNSYFAIGLTVITVWLFGHFSVVIIVIADSQILSYWTILISLCLVWDLTFNRFVYSIVRQQ